MTGKQLDQKKFDQLITELIQKNPEYEDALEGFRYWSDDQSYRTVYYYLIYIINFLKETNKSIEDIKLDDYTRYASKQKKYSSGNQISKYSALKRFAEYLVVSGRKDTNFMNGARRPKYIETQKQIEKREEKVLTTQEIKKIISDIEHGIGNHRKIWFQEEYRSRDMAIVLLFLSTGIRASALVNLNIEDLDLENETITVTDKGDKVNVHNLPSDTILILKKWLLKRQELLIRVGREKEENALFLTKSKGRPTYNAVKDIICKYCSQATGRHITPHVLRATYATILYNKTHDIEFVRDQMNHSSVVTTQRYIRGNGKANRQKAANIMGDVLSRSKRPDENLFADFDEEEDFTIVELIDDEDME